MKHFRCQNKCEVLNYNFLKALLILAIPVVQSPIDINRLRRYRALEFCQPFRYSRQTQREALTVKSASQAAWPGAK